MALFLKWLDRLKEDRKMRKVLTGGKSPFFTDEEVGHEGELPMDELKFLGRKLERPTKVMRENLIDEYSHLKRVRKSKANTANLAISITYNSKRRSSVFRKFVKMSDGEWYTLNSHLLIQKVSIKPVDSKEWLLFVV